ncbi:MAG: bifunctional diguanylate cyclase/phosphodiesterase [Pseudomonadota bacterium]
MSVQADAVPMIVSTDDTFATAARIADDPAIPAEAVIEADEREVAFRWDLKSDELIWAANAAACLNVEPCKLPATGDAFHMLIVDEHVRRREAVMERCGQSDLGTGVAYRIAYRVAPHGPRSSVLMWVEESGRWWADEDGRPMQARGVLKVNAQAADAAAGAAIDYDELTGQLTRMRLTDAVVSVSKRVANGRGNAALLMIAVNNLQRINDSFGYETGDQVLAEVGHRLRSEIRAGDTLGRYSGNKFGLILSQCAPDEVEVAADRIRQAASAFPVQTANCKIVVSISIGAVLLPDHADTADIAYGRVLRALDEARYNRREAFAVYEPDQAHDLRRQRCVKIGEFIDRALAEDRLELVLQPIVWSDQRTPAFYECLLRIKSDNQDEIFPPSEFIPIAEELGLASLIDQRTLALATDLLLTHDWLKLSLNVSALTCTNALWIRDLSRRVSANPEIASRLVIEITETVAATNTDEAAHFVDIVRDLGCRVAIDDFGAGYTSFANLKRVPADILKIDGSFVENMMDDRSDRVFVRTMVEIAESFGMETVAEWVGDDTTADYISRLGVTYIQGFHFGAPRPIAEIVAAHHAREKAR